MYLDELRLMYIIPLKDAKEHEEGPECHCRPRRINLDNHWILFMHNSYDGREAVEFAYHVIDNYEVGDDD